LAGNPHVLDSEPQTAAPSLERQPPVEAAISIRGLRAAHGGTWKATAQLLVDSATIPALPALSTSFTNEFIDGC
jgi:hypothetical protein